MNITLEQTCGACPEQYDARDETGRMVGYLRLRHGHFSADAIDADGGHHRVYDAQPEGDGVFDPDERDGYLATAVRAIRAHLDPAPEAQRDALRDRLAEALRRKATSDWHEGGDGDRPLMLEIYLDDAVNAVLGVIAPEGSEEAPR